MIPDALRTQLEDLAAVIRKAANHETLYRDAWVGRTCMQWADRLDAVLATRDDSGGQGVVTMDLDYARAKILQATANDVPVISDVILDMLRVLGDMDDRIGQLLIRIQDLERSAAPVQE